jgi:ParB-like chromosome segregation protein Spo0J
MTTASDMADSGESQPYWGGEISATILAPVHSLLAGDSPRLQGENDGHIQVLAAIETPLPPILVHRQTMRIIDGMHRLRAAMLKGREHIEIRFFDGTDDEAFIIAVRANMAHGLPLTLADREMAAKRILATQPQRSDRWIAETTGLAASTIAAVRGRISTDDQQITHRVGRDGRLRPLNIADGRMRVSDELKRHPEASLREIAQAAGVSPSTAKDVRERIQRGDDPVPLQRKNKQWSARGPRPLSPANPITNGAEHHPQSARLDHAALLERLRRDPSLRFTESGRALVGWLDVHANGLSYRQPSINDVAPHVWYIIIQIARHCAAEWLHFAGQLEQRLGNMESALTSDMQDELRYPKFRIAVSRVLRLRRHRCHTVPESNHPMPPDTRTCPPAGPGSPPFSAAVPTARSGKRCGTA